MCLGLLLCACPTPEPTPSPLDDPDSGVIGPSQWADGGLDLGTAVTSIDGTESFAALTAETVLHQGPQGGFHVPIMVRTQGHTEPNVTFDIRVRRSSDGLLLSRTSPSYYDISGTWFSSSNFLFLCPPSAGVNLDGAEVVFEVTASRSNSMLLTVARAKTVLRCGGSSQCQSICKG